MATWVVGAAVASIVATALLAWVLFRINAGAVRDGVVPPAGENPDGDAADEDGSPGVSGRG
ncbi:MAG: hypothetical protein BroJett013_14360 [Alphaproteobacteria bacterium]|nr:MAG: hypothetical protein BroJett013_14360 [Alphaproteobacteria bacterium]